MRLSDKALLTSPTAMFRCAKIITNLFVLQIVRTSPIRDRGNTARGSFRPPARRFLNSQTSRPFELY